MSDPIIVTAEEYRYGWPAPLSPLPLRTVLADLSDPTYQKLSGLMLDLLGVLHVHKVNAQPSQVTYRRTLMDFVKRFVPGEDLRQCGITIYVKVAKSKHWVAAISDIVALLKTNSLEHVRVELIDERAHRYFFPAKADPINRTFEKKWPSIREKVLDCIGSGTEWETLTVLNKGRTEDTSKLTVTIGVTNQASLAWKVEKHAMIADVLERYNVGLAYVRSDLWSTTCFSDTLGPVNNFSNQIPMGFSCGIGERTGTFGGYVRVQLDGREQWMGLTSQQVIPRDPDVLHLSQRPAIAAPSDKDQQDTIQFWSQRLVHIQANVQNLKTGKLSGGRDVQDRLRFYENLTQDRQQRIAIATDANINFGTVNASSGAGRAFGQVTQTQDPDSGIRKRGRAIDWALIKFTDYRREGDNTIPVESLLNYYMFHYPEKRQVQKARESLRIGDDVFKTGRSGASRGEVNQYKVDIKLPGQAGELREAYVIQSMGEPRGYSICDPFVQDGDAGSLGLKCMGEWTCLCIGGNMESGSGYAIPLGDVYRDIKDRTGATITEPEMQWGLN